MDITKTLKERFCKDNNISIKVFHEPYFTERLELFNRVMPENNILNKYNQFLEYLKHFETEEEYFDEYARIKNEAILAIKNNPKYQEFNTMDFNKNGIKYNLPYPEKERGTSFRASRNARELFFGTSLLPEPCKRAFYICR